jgi:hypothetical protein
MYALTFCYEGYDDCTPYAWTLAVSDDIEKLRTEMQKCIDEDCREPNEDDEDEMYDDSINYEVVRKSENDVLLNHREFGDLYTRYTIHIVEVL